MPKELHAYIVGRLPYTEENRAWIKILRKNLQPGMRLRVRGNGRNEKAIAEGLSFPQSTPLPYCTTVRLYVEKENWSYEDSGYARGVKDGLAQTRHRIQQRNETITLARAEVEKANSRAHALADELEELKAQCPAPDPQGPTFYERGLAEGKSITSEKREERIRELEREVGRMCSAGNGELLATQNAALRERNKRLEDKILKLVLDD
jgi:chromosome segregation ATPase